MQTEARQQLEEVEHIEVCLIRVGELLHNARYDRMTDPLTVFYAQDTIAKIKENA